MAISIWFGLPGCGKTSMYAKLAKDCDDWIERRCFISFFRRCPYDHIYGNIDLIGIKNYTKIRFSDLGVYDISNALVLIDEATLEADNRDFKNFKSTTKEFFLTHRHFRCDCHLFVQRFDALDLRIRSIADRCYYLYKTPFTAAFMTKYYRVPYSIIIPDPKKSDGEKLGEIIQGYCKPSFIVRLFTPPFFRKRYYKYFDSWSVPELPPLPIEHHSPGEVVPFCDVVPLHGLSDIYISSHIS